MQPLIYDVAVSADGFIAGVGGDVSRFPHEGPVVDDYMARLQGYGTALMGRHTYAFGYRYGLSPGANPYPWMETIVFSETLEVPDDASIRVVRRFDPETITQLKHAAERPVYLCGGGAFAGALLEQGLIDVVRVKRAPVFLGAGTPLFAAARGAVDAHLVESRPYPDGFFFQEFELAPRM